MQSVAGAKETLKNAGCWNDPEVVAYAREPHNCWQEHVSDGGNYVGMIEANNQGRFKVGRLLGEPVMPTPDPADETYQEMPETVLASKTRPLVLQQRMQFLPLSPR
ncbi:MAG: hypothetical protein AAGF10_07720 [Verrucomicrobiota bacterium]